MHPNPIYNQCQRAFLALRGETHWLKRETAELLRKSLWSQKAAINLTPQGLFAQPPVIKYFYIHGYSDDFQASVLFGNNGEVD